MKWDAGLKTIAGDILGFIDQLRASGYSIEQAWDIAWQVLARFQYLRSKMHQEKDDPRHKPLELGQVGMAFAMKYGRVTKLAMQEKWDKTKHLVNIGTPAQRSWILCHHTRLTWLLTWVSLTISRVSDLKCFLCLYINRHLLSTPLCQL